MIQQSKNLIYKTILTGSLSELDEDDDETGLNENDFELPIKTTLINHDTNFPDLLSTETNSTLQDSNANSNNTSAKTTVNNNTTNNDKRVRFDTELDKNNDGIYKSKRGIEDLLQTAAEVNDFIGDNLDRLSALNSDSNTSLKNSLYKILSDNGTNRTESLSNFDLSEDELDTIRSRSSENIDVTLDNILHNGELCHSEENINNTNGKCNDMGHTYRNTEDSIHNNQSVDSTSSFDFSEISCKETIENYIANKNENNTDKINELDDDFQVKLLYDPQNININNISISVEQAMANFEETIQLINDLSHRDDMLDDQMVNPNKFHVFCMKNTPSVSYHDLLKRIQSKCMFGSIIYQTATYLFQILFLQRQHSNENMKCTHVLHHDEIHRIIIATIRVGAKLTEDFVHSHQYFCKVCGISKKLLSKLEVSLLICLKQNRLMITSERMAASVDILEELRNYI